MRMSFGRRRGPLAFVLFLALLASCTTGSNGGQKTDPSSGAIAANAVVVDDLVGPTQFADGPDGWLLVAQLAGEEDASKGEILAIDLKSNKRRVLYRGLDKPTGVAWLAGAVWIMERRRIQRGVWSGDSTAPGPLEAMTGDLPFNGRSEGTLTVSPDNKLIYETTGALSNGTVTVRSGVLWAFDPDTRSSAVVATGLKNAYAHAFLPSGDILTTEIGDTKGVGPVEELNAVPYPPTGDTPADAGWPTCTGDLTCPGVITPLAVFAPNSTPTGIAIDESHAYVSLLVTGEVHRVSLQNPGAPRVASTLIASNLNNPHTLMMRADGTLWVSEHSAGRIVAIKLNRQ